MAGMMGWPIERVYRSTLPEIYFPFRGYLRALGVDPDGNDADAPMTQAEFEDLERRYPDVKQDG